MSREGLQTHEIHESHSPKKGGRLKTWLLSLALLTGVEGVLNAPKETEAQEKRPNATEKTKDSEKETSPEILKAIHKELNHHETGSRNLEFLSADGKNLTGIYFKARRYDPKLEKTVEISSPMHYKPEGGYLIFGDTKIKIKGVKLADGFKVVNGKVETDYAVIFLEGNLGNKLYVGHMKVDSNGEWNGNFDFYENLGKSPLSEAQEADLLRKLKGIEIDETNQTFKAPEGVELFDVGLRSKCTKGPVDDFLQGGSFLKVVLGDKTIVFDNGLFGSLGCDHEDKPAYLLLRGHCANSNQNLDLKGVGEILNETPIVWLSLGRKAPGDVNRKWNTGPAKREIMKPKPAKDPGLNSA